MTTEERIRKYREMRKGNWQLLLFAFFLLGVMLTATSCSTRHYPPPPKWKGYQLVFEERTLF